MDFAGKLVGIDLAAEKLLAAEREEHRIAVEIKSFQGTSNVAEFHTALGQFLNYRFVIGKAMPERTLYLAIPVEAYEGFFQESDVQEIIENYQIKLLVYDPGNEELQSLWDIEDERLLSVIEIHLAQLTTRHAG